MINSSKIATAFLAAAVILSASVPAVMAAGHSAVSQTEKAYSVVTNGKLLDDVSVFEEDGIINVQLAPIVKSMGESIQWDEDTQTAIITKKDQTVIKVTVNKTVATINDKDVILSTKKIDNVIVPSSARATSTAGKLFVPVEAFKNAFGYSVQVKNRGSEKIIMIQESTEKNKKKEAATPVLKGGKLDLPYPASNWVPPLIKSEDTGDKYKNYKILESELGLVKGAFFIPHSGSNRIELSDLMVSAYDDGTTHIVIYTWYGSKTEESVHNRTPYIGREVFKFYFSKDHDKLFNIVDKGLTGNLDTKEFLNKEFVFDGRKVLIKKTGEAITIFISKK
ncbi:stalk domain-containing protein [Paenibacillus chartarius]|uniref:Stalk domain-containing protein n=1 Tax=Paenibacillus chartarius TaxID=747481 RepID=A0ABV6DHI1_9BACL